MLRVYDWLVGIVQGKQASRDEMAYAFVNEEGWRGGMDRERTDMAVADMLAIDWRAIG